MAAVDPGPPAPTTVEARPRRVAKRDAPELPYLNRELSWLEFNARVLYEARDARNPLLERVKFAAIFAGNLDEFFQVRIAGLRQQVEAGTVTRAPDGRTPAEQLAHARERVLELVAERRPGLLVFGPDRERLKPRTYRRAAKKITDRAACLVWLAG